MIYSYWGGGGSTKICNTNLYCLPDTDSNVYICSTVRTNVLGRYLDDCNATGDNKKMWQYDLAQEKY